MIRVYTNVKNNKQLHLSIKDDYLKVKVVYGVHIKSKKCEEYYAKRDYCDKWRDEVGKHFYNTGEFLDIHIPVKDIYATQMYIKSFKEYFDVEVRE